MLLQFNVTVIHSHLQIYLDNEFYAKLVFCTVEVKYKLYIEFKFLSGWKDSTTNICLESIVNMDLEMYLRFTSSDYALFGYLITKVDVVILS